MCISPSKTQHMHINTVMKYHFEVRHPRCVGSITKNFLCITQLLKQRDLVPPTQPPLT